MISVLWLSEYLAFTDFDYRGETFQKFALKKLQFYKLQSYKFGDLSHSDLKAQKGSLVIILEALQNFLKDL